MELNERQQQLRSEYEVRLNKCDREALAREISIMLVMIPLLPVEKILKGIEANSKIIRNSRAINNRNKKKNRLRTLAEKNKLTKDEKIEFLKLCRELKIEVPQ